LRPRQRRRRAPSRNGPRNGWTRVLIKLRVPLNDDDEERAKRRHAFAEQQRNSLRASSTPVGKKARRSLAAQAIDPHTPNQDQDHDMPDVAGSAVTPMKRVLPLASNFEDWIKMATDNKINATNSWNFALIDYFHEMSLLKEGDGVNFQKASCTLDGCVKIYTSRVDSVATDTGKLLSGLADNSNKNRRGEDDEDGEDGEGEEGEDGQKKKRKRAARTAETTLATSFEQLQNKRMEVEFAQDPLFRKATADFDEGGAKGLLMNHLAIDSNGRIVFDSSDDAGDVTGKQEKDEKEASPSASGNTPEPQEEVQEEDLSNDIDIDLAGLAAKYFPNLAILDKQDICPSMKEFDLGDVNGSLDLPFLKAPEQDETEDSENEAGNVSGVFLDDNNAAGFDDDDEMGGFDMGADVGFGEGGEAFAQELAMVPNARVHNHEEEGDGEPIESIEGQTGTDEQYALTMNHARDQEHENILSYFDQALKKNWAGPEHWRIRRIKEAGKAATVTKRKEKEPFEIDFTAPMSQELANALYTPAASAAAIMLPKSQWVSKTRNLLPDDKHFNSKNLLRLFLKPKIGVGSRRTQKRQQELTKKGEEAEGAVDEAFWANRAPDLDDDAPVQGNYDADFYNDDALPFAGGFDDDDDFADARDHFSPPPTQPLLGTQATDVPNSQANPFGADLITQSRRFRPEYVNYARRAKVIDVKKLKDNLWTSMGIETVSLSCAIIEFVTDAFRSPHPPRQDLLTSPQ
jgi:condensin complex subunit 2